MEITDRLITWISLALARGDVERIDSLMSRRAREASVASLEKIADFD